MKGTYTSPVMTVECFVTGDIITISLHNTTQTVNTTDNTKPLPVIDADKEFGA